MEVFVWRDETQAAFVVSACRFRERVHKILHLTCVAPTNGLDFCSGLIGVLICIIVIR